MQVPYPLPKRILVIGIVFAGLVLAAWFWFQQTHGDGPVPSHPVQLQSSSLDGWQAFGGSWESVNGSIRSDSSERGAKLLTGSKRWKDYTLSVDMRFDGVAADMGVTVRSSNESKGVDSYNGYFVGLRSLDGTFVVGHSNYTWVEALPAFLPGGVRPFVWYRLRITAVGCNIAASAQNLTTLQTAWIAFEDHPCVRTGRIGLRSLNANGMWRNISVVPATRDDYLDLERHAGSVEHPVILDGPPWWTPWHVGMLFVSALGLALMTQLAIFRIQRWKAYAITQERERMAHDIHDTMAQSFAGVGYQIQGIRRAIIRGDHLDRDHVAEQLTEAYQLVRRCHEEASRTVAMLGASSPEIQHNLLAALAQTAHKLAGDQLNTVTKLNGNPTPLNLRLVDALLRTGQEAVANAVSHSDPSELTITLNYRENEVELIVEDNGNGFEYNPETAGFGILGMQKRARAVGGTLHIQSAPGRGTQVRMKARLQKGKANRRVFALVKERVLSPPPDLDGG